MLSLLRDAYASLQLRFKYRRLVQEQLLELAESRHSASALDDARGWIPLASEKSTLSSFDRADVRTRARRLVEQNPHAKNVLRLLEIYVTGPGFQLTHIPAPLRDVPLELLQQADQLVARFLVANQRHFSFREFARRAWRDGEAFLRFHPAAVFPGHVRFIDPEEIGPDRSDPASEGILTQPNDVESPVAYLRVPPGQSDPVESIPANQMLHTRINVDSNQKRGVSLFAPVLDDLSRYDRWLETELTARKLQASIVLWRRIQGSPNQVSAQADAASDAFAQGIRKERVQPGTILTTSHSTDLQFLQPHTNFADAVPLGRMVLLAIAAGAGVPEFMLTSDASNANFSSTMVAEGPAVKLFESEQQFFANQLHALWRWIIDDAVRHRLLPEDAFDILRPRWHFPQLVTRDRSKDRLADVQLLKAGVLSRSEVARRDNADPAAMQRELAHESPASPSA